jgi:hypothetical protein
VEHRKKKKRCPENCMGRKKLTKIQFGENEDFEWAAVDSSTSSIQTNDNNNNNNNNNHHSHTHNGNTHTHTQTQTHDFFDFGFDEESLLNDENLAAEFDLLAEFEGNHNFEIDILSSSNTKKRKRQS